MVEFEKVHKIKRIFLRQILIKKIKFQKLLPLTITLEENTFISSMI